jgi:hypothetical protein
MKVGMPRTTTKTTKDNERQRESEREREGETRWRTFKAILILSGQKNWLWKAPHLGLRSSRLII